MLTPEPSPYLLEQCYVPANTMTSDILYATSTCLFPGLPFHRAQQTAPVPTGVAALQSDELYVSEPVEVMAQTPMSAITVCFVKGTESTI